MSGADAVGKGPSLPPAARADSSTFPDGGNVASRSVPPTSTTDVRVHWCGISYLVGVKTNESIKELKSQTCELAGLPSKRQKHMDSENKVLDDDYPVATLQPPHCTELISLNNTVEVEVYKNHFYHKKPACTILATKDRIKDFNGSRTKLSKGTYKVGSMKLDCLIKPYMSEEKIDLLRSIELMRTWRHPNLVVLENLYKEKTKKANRHHRLVLSNTVDGSLEGFIKSSLKENEDVVSNADGTFTVFFTNIIMDLCAVLDEMVKRKICPTNLSRENLYLKKMKNLEPQLKIIFDKVCRLEKSCEAHLLSRLCNDIKKVCTPDSSVDVGTQAFLDFLGNGAVNFVGRNLAKTARSYPINWTYQEKSKYLINLIPSSTALRKALNNCGITWPKGKDGADMSEDLQELKKAVDKENENIKSHNEKILCPLEKKKEEIMSKEKDQKIREQKLKDIEQELAQAALNLKVEIPWNYDTKYAHDLIRLIRNLWKHYDTYPWSIRKLLGSKDGTLVCLEKWCPDVWVQIYNAVGLGF